MLIDQLNTLKAIFKSMKQSKRNKFSRRRIISVFFLIAAVITTIALFIAFFGMSGLDIPIQS